MIGSSSLASLGEKNWLPSDTPASAFDDEAKVAPVLSSPPIVYSNIKKSTKLLKPLKRDELLTTQFKEISLLSQFDLLETISFDNQTLSNHKNNNKRKNKTSPSKYIINNNSNSISSPSKHRMNTSSSMTSISTNQYDNDISCYDDYDDQPETPLNHTSSSAAPSPTKKHANTWTNASSSSQHAKIASPSSFRAQGALPPFGHDFYPQHPTHRPPPLVPPVLPRSLPLVHSALSFDDSTSMMTEQYNNTLHTTNNNDNNTTYTTTSIHDVPDLSLPNSPSYTHPYPIIDTGTVSKPYSKREKYANYTLYNSDNNNTTNNTFTNTNNNINSIIITQLVSAENHVTNLHNNYLTREAQYKQQYIYEQQVMSQRMSQRALAREQHLYEIYTKQQQYKLFINNKVNVINENRRKSTIHILQHIQTLLEEDKKLEESQNYDRILHTRERDRQLTDDFQNKYDPEVVRIQKMEVRIMTFLLKY